MFTFPYICLQMHRCNYYNLVTNLP